MATTLSQLLAIEAGVRQQDADETSSLTSQLRQGEAFSGEIRTYRPLKEGGLQRPEARTNIVADARELLQRYRTIRSRVIDVTASKDVSNRGAEADLVVDGETLATSVPAVTLLALEKYAEQLVAFIKALPVLNPTENWTYDQASGAYRSEGSKSISTSKETIPLVLWEPDDPSTSKHGPQVDKVVSDVPVGEWTVTKFSTALPADKKRELLSRALKLRDAVKVAREAANRAPVTDVSMGDSIFTWLFAE